MARAVAMVTVRDGDGDGVDGIEGGGDGDGAGGVGGSHDGPDRRDGSPPAHKGWRH